MTEIPPIAPLKCHNLTLIQIGERRNGIRNLHLRTCRMLKPYNKNVDSATISDTRNITITKSLAKQKERQKTTKFVRLKFARQNF